MSTSVVSVRIPRRLKEELEREVPNWRKALVEYLEILVKRERRRRVLEKARRLEEKIGVTSPAAEIIRETRDAR